MPGRRIDRTDVAVAGLAVLLAALALIITLNLSEATGHPRPLPWWVLAGAFAAAEAVVVHLQVRRESVSLSFAEIPTVVGLAFVAPAWFVLASVTGSALVLVVQRRQAGLKLAFNLAQFAVQAALAQLVYLTLAGSVEPTTVQAGGATLAAVVCADLASALAVTAAIGLTTGQVDREPMVETLTTGLIGAVANTCFALLALLLLIEKPAALVLLLMVFVALVVVYREYADLGRGHSRLELLYRFTRGVAAQVDIDQVAARVLREARDVTQSGRAELALLATADRPARRLHLDDGDDVPTDSAGRPRWWAAALQGEAVLLPRGSPEAAGELAAAGLRDALGVPLQAGGAVFGVLAVAHRPPFLPTYGRDDLRMFQSLADHAAVALQNVALVEELRTEVAERQHQALHDSRTGLANRRRFSDRLAEEMAGERPVGVLLLDLTGFGEINDALGYGTGDSLLVEVGVRLADHLGREQLARLGNDEFAALLLDSATAEDAQRRAATVLHTLKAPFQVTGFAITISAQAGLALCPEHGTDPDKLLQRVDTALSAAKRDGTELTTYSPWMDQSSGRRLQLISDLRDAVAQEQLTVHYQPKVHPLSGNPIGAEALVRWTHPEIGVVGPDEFIPLAEHAGLMGPLTTLVLRAALVECARWRADGREMTVAVNLSTRSLNDPDLPGRVAAEIASAGLPPPSVILEITESAMMTDVSRSLAVLHRLRATGVSLSVDDFGTGHSALAYLKHLPVQEIKIDKSFVQGICSDPVDAVIVRTTIELGHSLGLRVVAEGVDDDATRTQLADAGCDVLQGYLFGRPQPADRFAAWLASTAPMALPLQRRA